MYKVQQAIGDKTSVCVCVSKRSNEKIQGKKISFALSDYVLFIYLHLCIPQGC